MKRSLSELAPPGTNLGSELIEYGIMLFSVFGLSWRFLFHYNYARNELYTVEYGRRILRDGAVIESFDSLMRGCFSGFWMLAVFCAGMTLAHWMSFRVESKSVYLMKRVPSAAELPFRCLALPIAALVSGLVWCGLLTLVYWLIYRFATPASCLPETIIFHFGRTFL